jgi:hypothetical protein
MISFVKWIKIDASFHHFIFFASIIPTLNMFKKQKIIHWNILLLNYIMFYLGVKFVLGMNLNNIENSPN